MIVGEVTSYASSTQYQYFGTTVSTDRIEALMSKYGIIQTGNKDKDMAELYSVMYAEAKSEVGSSATAESARASGAQSNQPVAKKASSSVPWASLMSEVGLAATGKITTDYDAFSQKIDALQQGFAASQDQNGAAFVSQLQAQASIVFVQNQSGASASMGAKTTPQSGVSGLDIVAQLNKLYLVDA